MYCYIEEIVGDYPAVAKKRPNLRGGGFLPRRGGEDRLPRSSWQDSTGLVVAHTCVGTKFEYKKVRSWKKTISKHGENPDWLPCISALKVEARQARKCEDECLGRAR